MHSWLVDPFGAKRVYHTPVKHPFGAKEVYLQDQHGMSLPLYLRPRDVKCQAARPNSSPQIRKLRSQTYRCHSSGFQATGSAGRTNPLATRPSTITWTPP